MNNLGCVSDGGASRAQMQLYRLFQAPARVGAVTHPLASASMGSL